MMTNRIVRHNGIQEHDRFCDCLHCRLEWEDYWEAERALDELARQDGELRQAKPATDEEWQAFLEGEWPRVKEGVSRG